MKPTQGRDGRDASSCLRRQVAAQVAIQISEVSPMRLSSGFPTFKPVHGFEESHVISNYGVVVRRERHTTSSVGIVRFYPMQTLKATRTVHGYYHMNMHGVDGKKATMRVHTMVLEAFVCPRPEGLECLHINGDKTDNQLSNLRWGTHRENGKDRSLHGNSGHVLNFQLAQEIRALRGIMRQVDVAEAYGISQCLVSQIQLGKVWNVAEQEVAV